MPPNDVNYLPVAAPFFAALIVLWILLVIAIVLRTVQVSYERLGFSPHAAILLLLASLAGSYINIPVARLPEKSFVSGEVVIFNVMGGIGTLVGPFAGAAFFLLLREGVSRFFTEYYLIPVGVLFILMIVFLPQGLLGFLRRTFNR